MMQDKYRNLIEVGHLVRDTEGLTYKVVFIEEDGQMMRLQEIREDGHTQVYNCNNKACRKMWIVGQRSNND